MPLQFRLARRSDYDSVEHMVISSFEPITWFKKLDERYGSLNGMDWRQRWRARMTRVFETEIGLVGETGSSMVAFASGTLDSQTRMGFVDLLAVDRSQQGKGYGREMLRGMLDHFKREGALYVNLECLVDNDTGNSLYRSEGFEEVARSIRWFKKL